MFQYSQSEMINNPILRKAHSSFRKILLGSLWVAGRIVISYMSVSSLFEAGYPVESPDTFGIDHRCTIQRLSPLRHGRGRQRRGGNSKISLISSPVCHSYSKIFSISSAVRYCGLRKGRHPPIHT